MMPRITNETIDSTLATLYDDENYAKDTIKEIKENNPVLYSLLETVSFKKDDDYARGYIIGASQFYSLIIYSVEDAKVENNIISISLNFISEQMLNNDEGKIIKNKDTWTFEKPVNSSTPIWILTQT